MGAERLVPGVIIVTLCLVLVAVWSAGQAGGRGPFPFGSGQPAGCAAYGLSVVENVSYWFCDTNINATFWHAFLGFGNFTELAHVTYADLEFNVEGYEFECPGLVVTGFETSGANHTFDVSTYTDISGPCSWPTRLVLSPDYVFGAVWESPGSVELLVRAASA